MAKLGVGIGVTAAIVAIGGGVAYALSRQKKTSPTAPMSVKAAAAKVLETATANAEVPSRATTAALIRKAPKQDDAVCNVAIRLQDTADKFKGVFYQYDTEEAADKIVNELRVSAAQACATGAAVESDALSMWGQVATATERGDEDEVVRIYSAWMGGDAWYSDVSGFGRYRRSGRAVRSSLQGWQYL